MKHMFLKSATALFLSIAILVSACSKGDAGPAGEKGDKGDTGDKGTTGATGKPGTANVIYSEWMDVEFGRIDTTTTRMVGVIEAPKLVDSILQKGEIKVYWNIGSASDPFIVSLPYLNNRALPGYVDLWINAYYQPGGIALISNYDVSSAVDAGEAVWQYRYVLIPGGVTARSAVNWNDYASVKAYLGLKD